VAQFRCTLAQLPPSSPHSHPFHALRLLALALLAAGCTGTIVLPPAQEGGVGAAPLRRLTNAEYLNTLGDLFPQVQLSLPSLPADTIVGGFENAAEGQTASDVLVARYERIGRLYAEALTPDDAAVTALTGCTDWSTPELADACGDAFVRALGERAFRRPLAADEHTHLLQAFAAWRGAIDFQAAVTLSIEALLQHPAFLYRVELPDGLEASTVSPVEPYALASRLSYFLWESAPDEALLRAAANDELSTPAQLREQAWRMLDDPRARRTFWSFHRQWLNLERVLQPEHAVRTPEVDPWWTPVTQQAAVDETRRFIENALTPAGTLSELLLSRRAWVDGETSRIYGLPGGDGGLEVREVLLPEGERAGVLTRAAFLAGTSHPGATSPPIRGNQLFVRLLCQPPRPPPANINVTPPSQSDGGPSTNRQLFEARTQPGACQGCHVGLNGLGFGFEHFSASGATQASDHGLPIDASGQLVGTDVDGRFDGALELSFALAGSAQVEACASSMWVRYALGRSLESAETPTLDVLTQRFIAANGDVRALLLDVVTSPSFRKRRGQLAGAP
jgi:hypothetical protein